MKKEISLADCVLTMEYQYLCVRTPDERLLFSSRDLNILLGNLLKELPISDTDRKIIGEITLKLEEI